MLCYRLIALDTEGELKMRRFAFVIVLLGLLAPLGKAIGQCVSSEDQATAGLLALRNQMIVVAYQCGRQAEYNRYFVMRFRPLLQDNDRMVTAYFQRMYGGEAAESAKDHFITDMTNVMSGAASRMEGAFCQHGDRMIADMSGMRSMGQLLSYAAYHDVSPPGMSLCNFGGRRRM